jgi:pectate lyase
MIVRSRLALPRLGGGLARRAFAGGAVAVGLSVVLGCSSYDYYLGGGAGAGGATAAGGSAGSVAAPTGLVGWAAVADCGPSGTVGGREGPTVTPTTVDELRAAAAADGASVIELMGSFQVGDEVLDVTANKTLVGLDGAMLIGALRVTNATNVVIRNLRIDGGPTTENRDAVEVTESSCVWIDHCEIFDGADGNLDIVRGSDFITVSWSRFYYAAKTDNHRFSNLGGNEDWERTDKHNVTFHHNWWGDGVLAQMPRVRYGMVHVFNNYYSSAGNEYCIGAGYMARLLVQNNVFDGVTDPIRFQVDEDPETGNHTAEVLASGNDTTTATGAQVSTGVAFEPPYPFSLQSAADAQASVVAAAGVE